MKPQNSHPRPLPLLKWTLLLLCIPFISSQSPKHAETFMSHYQILSGEPHYLLIINTPFSGVLKPGELHYFEALLHVSDCPTAISGQSDSGDIEIYISTDHNNRYPNPDFYTYTTRTSIILTPEDREKACGTSKFLLCSIFISIMSTGDQEETPYLLSMRRDFSAEEANPPISLGDGRENQVNITRFSILQESLPYSGQLKPQESASFLFRSFSDIEEGVLKVDVEGSELEVLTFNPPVTNLTNYLWKETIPSGSKNHMIFLKNVVYILLSNPSNLSVSYHITMMMINSFMTFPLEAGALSVDIYAYKKYAFLFYSNLKDGEFSLNISFSTPLTEPVESALKKGHIVKGLYWPAKNTTGPSQEVDLERSVPEIEGLNVDQKLLIRGLAGTYMIEIANPWDFSVIFSIDLGLSHELSAENLQFEDSFGIYPERTYKILMTRPAKWYYWLYSCYGSVDLKFEKGNGEVESLWIPQGGSFTHEEMIEDRFREVKVKGDETERWQSHKISMYSALVDEEKLWDYEVINEDLTMSLAFDYEERGGAVSVEFDPVEFREPEVSDKVSYRVEICEIEEDGQEAWINICHEPTKPSYCQNYEIEVSVEHKEAIRVDFANVVNGKNFVKIKAFVKHKGQVIRFVPYNVSFVEIKSRFWRNTFIAVVIVVGVMVIWGLWKKYGGGERIKRILESQRIELPVVGRSYNQLEESEEAQSPDINEDSIE